MSSYPYDANTSNVIQPIPQNPPFPPMLKIFSVRNENDAEKGKGRGKGKERRGKGGGDRVGVTQSFFFQSNKCLGLPPKKRLFKVFSLTLTSK